MGREVLENLLKTSRFPASRVSAGVDACEAPDTEAIRRLTIEDSPVAIVNDLDRGDFYLEGREKWRRAWDSGAG